MKEASANLTKAEFETLQRTGYLKINDPERGEIEFRLMLGEDGRGMMGKPLKINVIRAGSAVNVVD